MDGQDRDPIVRVGWLGALVLAAGCLAPVLRTAYYSDDISSSLSPGIARFHGYSLARNLELGVRGLLLDGRFNPVMPLVYLGAYRVEDRLAYKGLIVAGVLADLLLFLALARRLVDGRFALLAGGLTLMCVQLRVYHDPIVSFHGLLQFVAAALLLSLLALRLYLEGRGWGWLALSVGLYLVCDLTYEISYPLVLLHLLMIAHGPRPPGVTAGRAARPFVEAAGACVALSWLIRWLHPSRNYIHSVGLDPATVLATLGRQASAGLPLSWFLADPGWQFAAVRSPSALAHWLARPDVAAIGLGAFALAAAGLRRRRNSADKTTPETAPGLALPAQLGAALAILPGLMISISTKYQAELAVGKGYLPVYLQYFGVGLLLATAARRLCGRCRPLPRLRWVVAALVAATTAVSYRANCQSADNLTDPPGANQAERRNLIAALRAGLLADVPEHSVVLLVSEYPGWQAPPFSLFFYAMHAGKRLAALTPTAWSPGGSGFEAADVLVRSLQPPSTTPYLLRDTALGPDAGYVVLGHLDADIRAGRPAVATELSLFVRSPQLFRPGGPGRFLVAGQTAVTAGRPQAPALLWSDRDLVVRRSGPDWRLYTIRPDAIGPLDPSTIWLELGPARAAAVARQLSAQTGADQVVR